MGGAAIADSGGSRGKKALDATLNLVPFIDLLCSLISFLLMTAVWTQIARLELKQGNAAPPDSSTPPPKTDSVELRIEVHEKGFTIVENNKIEIPVPCTGAVCVKITKGKDPKDGHDTNSIESTYDYVALAAKLKEEKAKYPDNKDVTVVVADGIPYNEMIKTMDTSLDVGLDGLKISGTPL
jgi:biopolymer transport protein TolR